MRTTLARLIAMATKKNEAIAILKGPYSHQIREIATNYTSVMFWGRFSDGTSDEEIGNGSIFFIDCGGGLLAVTANHVFDAYRARKEAQPDLICQIGNAEFSPEERLIDSDASLDVATFRITQDELRRDGKLAHTARAGDWPPRPPEEGKGVFFTGLPRVCWSRKGPNRFEWGTYSAILTATSVSDGKVACQFHREEMVDAFGTGLPPRGDGWAG